MDKKVLLMILDGWGIGTNAEVSAIDHAKTPFVDSLYKKYAHSKLEASGLAVGLPLGQMGNSEVGHMNIGAGRVVYQDLVKVNKAVEEGTLADNSTLIEAFSYARTQAKKVHFIGLLSDGGVHSHINHLKGLLSIAHQHELKNVFVHAFTDGRDTDPKGGSTYLVDLEGHMANTTGMIASVVGRYFAMDRDNRWERVKLAYDAMVNGIGKATENIQKSIKESYQAGVTDEFIAPIIHAVNGKAVGNIEEGDVVLCFNFRTDRGREITQALTQKDFPEQNMKALSLYYVTMTNYNDSFENVHVMFDKDNLKNTLGEVLEKAGKKQVRIAETEKYPHVTFFFSGGRETAFEGESRILCPSPKVATYD
ncbi:MAG: 2,3-bisphosphoglycerate-independent phosphoglycerate mutase, partial [Roseivirga sp.]